MIDIDFDKLPKNYYKALREFNRVFYSHYLNQGLTILDISENIQVTRMKVAKDIDCSCHDVLEEIRHREAESKRLRLIRKKGIKGVNRLKKRKKRLKMSDHMKSVAGLGCIVCKLQGFGDTPAELHHIRDGQGMGQRASNDEVIPLCPTHHRYGYKNVKEGVEEFGIHQRPEKFIECYGTELELLEKVRELL